MSELWAEAYRKRYGRKPPTSNLVDLSFEQILDNLEPEPGVFGELERFYTGEVQEDK